MILVDSSVWIDFVSARVTEQTTKLRALMGIKRIVVGDLVLAEVLQGCADVQIFEDARKLFDRFDFVILGGRRVAVQAARNYRHLRSLGFTVRKTIDTVIATKCILSDFQLLHNDRDFLPFEQHLGLKCIN